MENPARCQLCQKTPNGRDIFLHLQSRPAAKRLILRGSGVPERETQYHPHRHVRKYLKYNKNTVEQQELPPLTNLEPEEEGEYHNRTTWAQEKEKQEYDIKDKLLKLSLKFEREAYHHSLQVNKEFKSQMRTLKLEAEAENMQMLKIWKLRLAHHGNALQN